MMRRLHFAGLILALFSCALIVGSAQAGAAKPQPNKVKQTAKPIWTLAMDGPRVAYASAGRVYVWNRTTGATSVVKGNYTNAKHSVNAEEIAIVGRRLAWIKRQQLGNTELPTILYTARVGGSAPSAAAGARLHRCRLRRAGRQPDQGPGRRRERSRGQHLEGERGRDLRK